MKNRYGILAIAGLTASAAFAIDAKADDLNPLDNAPLPITGSSILSNFLTKPTSVTTEAIEEPPTPIAPTVSVIPETWEQRLQALEAAVEQVPVIIAVLEKLVSDGTSLNVIGAIGDFGTLRSDVDLLIQKVSGI